VYNLEKYSTNSMEIGVGPDKGHNDGCDIEEEGEGGDEEEDNDNEDIRAHQHDGCMFKEAVMDDIDLILDFTAGLKHQVQFFDQWLLNTLEQVGANFLQFVKASITYGTTPWDDHQGCISCPDLLIMIPEILVIIT